MAVTSVTRLPDRAGGIDQLWRRTYALSWRVECSSRDDGPVVIRLSGRLPNVGTPYRVSDAEYDNGAFLMTYDYTMEHGGANPDIAVWIVKGNYGPYDGSVFGTDPTTWPIRVSYASKSFEKAVETDQHGEPIRNSAGDRYETPVTIDDSRDIITVRRNELVRTFDRTIPSRFRDTVNASPWNGYDTHTVKCTGITTSDEQYDSNNQVYYYEVTYVFEVIKLDPDQSPQGWAKYLLDQGYQSVDGSGKKGPILLKGEPASDPQLLDGSGAVLASGGSPVYDTWDVYPEADFSFFGLNLDHSLGRV